MTSPAQEDRMDPVELITPDDTPVDDECEPADAGLTDDECSGP